MKIVLLCSGQANQIALANKIADKFNLVGIVIEKRENKKSLVQQFKGLPAKMSDRFFFQRIRKAWIQMLKYYGEKYKDFPLVEIYKTTNINDNVVRDFINELKPDLVLVSGTSLLKKNILAIPLPVGMLNLHTGLSPYVKGGPNCTNWCIANRQIYLIGNTIMWIDAGIDSGDILTSAVVKFTGNESLSQIHLKVMENAHDLYLHALKLINTGLAQRVKQSNIASGKTYFTKNWMFKQKRSLLENVKHFQRDINSDEYFKKLKTIKIIN